MPIHRKYSDKEEHLIVEKWVDPDTGELIKPATEKTDENPTITNTVEKTGDKVTKGIRKFDSISWMRPDDEDINIPS